MYAHWEGYSMSKHEVCVCIKCRMLGYWEGYSMSKQEACVCVCVSIQLYFLLLLNVECRVTGKGIQ